MAVAQTGAIYKALTFAGTSSRNYGVYITGEGVYNAPEREVEMIPIPGRNGAFALDKGRFENITVTYPAGIYADTEADFAQAVSDFRNFLCSKKGYCRLEDDYNTSEYRMAIYKSGLEVTPAMLRAGEFSITFDCKPQRWLTSGETATAVANNGTITNPTLFDSSPLLEFKGYGNISLAGQAISVTNASLGRVMIADRVSGEANLVGTFSVGVTNAVATYTIDSAWLNTGDDFTVNRAIYTYSIIATDPRPTSCEAIITSQTGSDAVATAVAIQNATTKYTFTFNPLEFKKGTAKTYTHTIAIYSKFYDSGGYIEDQHYRKVDFVYDGASTITIKTNGKTAGTGEYEYGAVEIGPTYGESTITPSGTKYIDLDIGEAYTTVNSSLVSLDYAVSLGAKLPTLAPGNNTITYDNTITNFKVTPRWWKV